MRYGPEHKAEIHRKIVKDASRRVRREGLQGAGVSAVMRDAGLTHGGFYKHFESKDELLLESLRDGFEEIADMLSQVAGRAKPGEGWKEIVKTYLSPEMCEHPERGCPLPPLACELGRVDAEIRAPIVQVWARYRDRMVPFMPGRRIADKERAFFIIFSHMTGTIALARILPQPMRAKLLASARDFLVGSFDR